VDEVLSGGLAWLAVALTAWLAVSSGLVALAALPGALGELFTGLARALTPHLLRRALSLGLGATVGVVALPAPAATATATAAGGDPSPYSATSRESPALTTRALGAQAVEPAPAPGFVPYTPGEAADAGPVLDSPAPSQARTAGTAAGTPTGDGDLPTPGWVPDRPTRTLAPDAAQLLRPALRLSSTTMETITVRRGDTLWSIAARHLGPTATEAEIAAEWPRWYAANRGAIGDEPDVISPGQQLVAPVAEPAR
jgi:nucleoid-associated protein YgaU